MNHSITDRVLSLAGVFQVASLVDQIANSGKANSVFVENSLETLFQFDADNVENIYGGVIGVQHGLRVMQHEFSTGREGRSAAITRYVISILSLEKKFSRNQAMRIMMAQRLQQIEEQTEFFDLGQENLITKLAEVYKDSISMLGPKIIVAGERPYLDNERNASLVRALLLAGIRSAVLWRQCGGNRWQVLFGRKKYLEECERLLS